MIEDLTKTGRANYDGATYTITGKAREKQNRARRRKGDDTIPW